MDWWTGVNSTCVTGSGEPIVSHVDAGGIFDPWINCDELDLGTILHQVSSTSSSSSTSSTSSGGSAGGGSISSSSLKSVNITSTSPPSTTTTTTNNNRIQQQVSQQQFPTTEYQHPASNSGLPDTDSNNKDNESNNIGTQLCDANDSMKPVVLVTSSMITQQSEPSSIALSSDSKTNQSLFSQMFLASNTQLEDIHNSGHLHHQTTHIQDQHQSHQLHEEADQHQADYPSDLWQKQVCNSLIQQNKPSSMVLETVRIDIASETGQIEATKQEPSDSSYDERDQTCQEVQNANGRFQPGQGIHFRSSSELNHHELQFNRHDPILDSDVIYNSQNLISGDSSPSLASSSSPAGSLADIFQQIGGSSSSKFKRDLSAASESVPSSSITVQTQGQKPALKNIKGAHRSTTSSNSVTQNIKQSTHQKTRRCRHITDYVLADEEKRLLIKEGYTDFPMICQARPLSKSEERILRKIRRKIRNKKSAQCSRQRKKEYVEDLERKYTAVARENEELKLILNKLQQQQQQERMSTNRSSIVYPLITCDSQVGHNTTTPTTICPTNTSNNVNNGNIHQHIHHHHQQQQQQQQRHHPQISHQLQHMSQNHPIQLENAHHQLSNQVVNQQHIAIDWRDVFGPPGKIGSMPPEAPMANSAYN